MACRHRPTRRAAIVAACTVWALGCGRPSGETPTMIAHATPARVAAPETHPTVAAGLAAARAASDPCQRAEACCNAIAGMPNLAAMVASCKQIGRATASLAAHPARRSTCEQIEAAMQSAARSMAGAARGGVPAACR